MPISNPYIPRYSQRIELGGDFDAGAEVKCERIGDTVTITTDGYVEHVSTSTPSSPDFTIPSRFLPSQIPSVTNEMTALAFLSNGYIAVMRVDDNGALSFMYRDYTGALVTQTGPIGGSISFLVT